MKTAARISAFMFVFLLGPLVMAFFYWLTGSFLTSFFSVVGVSAVIGVVVGVMHMEDDL